MTDKILIADDSSMMRMIIKNFIKKSGKEFEYIEAVDGNDALEKFKTATPVLTFLDIMMPNCSGIEAAKNIKNFNPEAKIVLCTSLKEEVQTTEAQNIGVFEYVTKPFNSEKIIEIINKL